MSCKPVVCEPLKDKVLLTKRMEEVNPQKVLIIFWHGLGDLVMFIPVFIAIRNRWRNVNFLLGVPSGLCYEDIFPGIELLTGEQVNETTEGLPYDLIVKITFPMNEGQTEYTKGEWCCIHELGIDPVAGHIAYPHSSMRPVGVHFQITCLPDAANPDEATAAKVWNDVLAAGFYPIETHFQHVFHNPVNKKFPFIGGDHVRDWTPRVKTLAWMISNLSAFVGVVSGPFHMAMALLPPSRVFLLEKDFKAGSFTKHKIATADLRNYKHEVKAWLEGF